MYGLVGFVARDDQDGVAKKELDVFYNNWHYSSTIDITNERGHEANKPIHTRSIMSRTATETFVKKDNY
jgi:hypothetical protein